MTGINEYISNQMKNVLISEGYSLEEAKDKVNNLLIDLTSHAKNSPTS